MKATFEGYINVDKNAVFFVNIERKGMVIGKQRFELKDGVNPDNYTIGEEYEIEGLVK